VPAPAQLTAFRGERLHEPAQHEPRARGERHVDDALHAEVRAIAAFTYFFGAVSAGGVAGGGGVVDESDGAGVAGAVIGGGGGAGVVTVELVSAGGGGGGDGLSQPAASAHAAIIMA
jgi:hypothetical protein